MDYHEKKAAEEAAKMKAGVRNKNAGFSQPGYNFGLGKFIRSKDEYHAEVKKAKEQAKREGREIEHL